MKKLFAMLVVAMVVMCGAMYLAPDTDRTPVNQNQNVTYKCARCGQVFSYSPYAPTPSKCPSCGGAMIRQ